MQLIKCYEAKRIQSRLCRQKKNGPIHSLWNREGSTFIFFISIVKNPVNAYQNSTYTIYTTFKGVVVLLARTFCSKRTVLCCVWIQPTHLELEVHFMFCLTFLFIMLYCIIRLEFFGSFLSYKNVFYQFFSWLFSYKIKYSLSK